MTIPTPASTIKLIANPLCADALWIAGVLALKGLVFERESAPATPKMLDRPRKTPFLIHDDLVLFDAVAIVEFLDETYASPRLYSTDIGERASQRGWCAHAQRIEAKLAAVLDAADGPAFRLARASLVTELDRLEAGIVTRPYFGSERITMVDAAWFPQLHRLDMVERHTSIDLLEPMPRLKRWQATLLGEPALQRATPETYEAAWVADRMPADRHLGDRLTTRPPKRVPPRNTTNVA